MKKKILVFDDDLEIFSVLGYLIEENGWELYTQNTCSNLLPKVREVKPDVILMDNWIPETGGMVATQAIKEQDDLKSIPVIYFSANNDIERLAKKAGADTFIPKPFDLDDLESTIRNFLH